MHRIAPTTFWYNLKTMNKTISRRDFLKLAGLGLTGLAFSPYVHPGDSLSETGKLVRVAIHSVSVYAQPNEKSRILFQHFRDEVVNVYYEVISPYGPGYNPLWYRVWGGYMHCARLQVVEMRENPVVSDIPKSGLLAEVTVPFTQAMLPSGKSWQEVYRLYYSTTHWIIALDQGPDGGPWYRLRDELTEIEYHVPASHLRIIPPDELTPLSPDVPADQKRIEVSVPRQMLTAYEGDKIVLQTTICTGVFSSDRSLNGVATSTPLGDWRVISKMPSKHMGSGMLTNDPEEYVLVGVPWTTFFHVTGVAFHGTYWHNNFGTPMSRGCVNMRTPEAKWLFRWTTPVAAPEEVEKRGYGTTVSVV